MLFEQLNLYVLKRISRLTEPIGNRARTLIVFVCFVIIGMIFSLKPSYAYDARRMALISLIVLLLTAACSEGEMKPVKWSKPAALSLELFALMMIVIRPLHSVGQGYMIFAFDILILLPMLYIVLINRAKQTRIIDLLSLAVIISGIVCFVFSMILAQGEGSYIVDGRVMGAVKNPNYYGMTGLALVISGIYNFASNYRNIGWRVMTAVITGIGISMMLVSVSRTAILSALICAAVYLLFLIKGVKGYSVRNEDPTYNMRNRILLSAAIILILVLTTVGALKLQQNVFYIAQSESNIHFASMQAVPFLPGEVYADDGVEERTDENQTIGGRFSADTDINTFSSGRIGIWKRYIEHFNLTGNDLDTAKKRGFFEGLTEYRAHNNIIDYAFRFGIPAGLLYTVFYIAIIVKAAKLTFGRRRFTADDLWVVMTAAVYAIYAMVEISTLPFTRYMPCLFFLSAAPLLTETANREES